MVKSEPFAFFFMIENQKNHYPNLNNKELTGSEQFCRLVKPLLSDKSKSKEKITLTEDKKLITKDKGNTELLNWFFVILLKILKYRNLVTLIFKQKIWSILSLNIFKDF